MLETRPGLHLQLTEAKDLAAAHAREEKRNKKHWAYVNCSAEEYEEVFRRIGRRSIHNFLEDRKTNGQQSYVIDIASGGGAIRGLAYKNLLTAGLSVGLTDLRSEEEKNEDRTRNIDVLAGDILYNESWRSIRKWLTNHNTDQADLIMCRAAAGFHYYPMPLTTIFLKKALALLRPNGMLITDIPWHIPQETAEKWIDDKLSTRRNLHVNPKFNEFRKGVLQIRRIAS